MKALNKYWYTPPHQRKDAATPVEFELKPLNQRTFLYLRGEASIGKRGLGMTVDGTVAAFEYGVVNWRGLDVEFSAAEKADVLNGAANKDWALWIEYIASELYLKALLGDDAAKNS